MLNILKMDLYKMFRSKSFYVLNIALILVVVCIAFLMRFVLTLEYDKAQESNVSYHRDEDKLSTNDPLLTEDEYYESVKEARDTMNVNEFMIFQYSEFIISILLVTFLAIFICSEWDTGFVKNIIPLNNSRTNLVISKNIIVFIFTIIQGVIALISAIIGNLIVTGKVNIFDFKELMIYLGLQILLRMAFASLIILISYVFRSKATSMSVGIVLAVNIHGIFLAFIDKLVYAVNLNLSKFTIANNISLGRFAVEDYKRVIILSILYFLIYGIISTIRVRRIEVN